MTTVLEHLIAAKRIAISHKDFETVKYLDKLIQWTCGRIETPSTKGNANA